jgi:hypothetical protein
VRSGDWKLYFPRTYRSLNGRNGGTDGIPVKYDINTIKNLDLYNLIDDPEEKNNVINDYPKIVNKLATYADEARKDLGDNLYKIDGVGLRKVGEVN